MKRIFNMEAASSQTSAAEVLTPGCHLVSRSDRCRTRNSDVLVPYLDLYLFLLYFRLFYLYYDYFNYQLLLFTIVITFTTTNNTINSNKFLKTKK